MTKGLKSFLYWLQNEASLTDDRESVSYSNQKRFDKLGDPLTADLVEEAADWAEAQAAPKVPTTCPCCGKRCAP